MLNSVVLVGNAGKDPEVRVFDGGKKKVTISMAVSRATKEKQTDWFEIQIWEKSADIAEQYLRKGHRFGIVGRLQQETWEDNGNKRSKIVVIASQLRLMQPNSEGGEPEQQSEPEPGDIFGGSFSQTSF